MADLLCQEVVDLDMARNRLDFSGRGIAPDGMGALVTSTMAAFGLQVAQQLTPFHPTCTVVLSASGEL